MPNINTTADNSPLTDEQWAGLAKLGDLGNRLDAFSSDKNPLAGPATSFLERLGEIDSRYDLIDLIENTLATLKVLETAGIQAMIRDNAQFIMDSLEVVVPVVSRWFNHIDQLPVDEWKADLEFGFTAVRKLRLGAEFVESRLAGEVTGKVVAATEFMQRNETDQAIADTLVLLGRLHRSGLLSRIGDLAELIAGLEEGTTFESLAGALVESVPEQQLCQLKNICKTVIHDFNTALQTPASGGLFGLLHILKDPDLQRLLRAVLTAAVSLEKQIK